MIKTYITKPVEKQAIQWDGKNFDEILKFVGESLDYEYVEAGINLRIKTLEGNMDVSIGDFIIKGLRGEFYPCKPDVFLKTYEEKNK